MARLALFGHALLLGLALFLGEPELLAFHSLPVDALLFLLLAFFFKQPGLGRALFDLGQQPRQPQLGDLGEAAVGKVAQVGGPVLKLLR